MKNRLKDLLMQGSPATRVAMGLVSLMITLLLLSDLFVTGFLPNAPEQARRERSLQIQLLASQVAQSLQGGHDTEVRAVLQQALLREPQLLSAGLFADGGWQVSAGDHASHWQLAPGATSNLENVRTAILADGQPWGELQLSFRPVSPRTLLGWLGQPVMLGLGLMSVLGFVVFQLYLRRAMRYLDPSNAVPERVRAALDTLTEGVLVLDTSQHILLANQAFHALAPDKTELAGAKHLGPAMPAA